jgi:hypothetical protein
VDSSRINNAVCDIKSQYRVENNKRVSLFGHPPSTKQAASIHPSCYSIKLHLTKKDFDGCHRIHEQPKDSSHV